jgi:hypothetical protein
MNIAHKIPPIAGPIIVPVPLKKEFYFKPSTVDVLRKKYKLVIIL